MTTELPEHMDNPNDLGPLALCLSEGLGRTRDVAALFCRADSHYKALPAVDVWDEARDARCWPGGAPLVAHPPCRRWAKS